MIKNLSVMLFAIVLLASCASTEKASVSNAQRDVNDTPNWITNPGILYTEYGFDTLIATGSGKSATPQLSETAAKVNALQVMSEEISAQIEGMSEDYASAAGYDANRALRNTENIGTVVTETTIKGARVMKRHFAKDGTVYVVYVVNLDSAVNQMTTAVSKAGPQDDEMYAKFRSEQAKAELKSRLQKNR